MFLSHLKATVLSVMLAVIYTFISTTFKIDIFTDVITSLTAVETSKSEKLIVLVLALGIGVVIDLNRARIREKRRRDMDAYRLQAMRATMATVHDVVNNFLNTLQLYRLHAERSGVFPEDLLNEFDAVVARTALQLRKIDELKNVEVDERINGIPILNIPDAPPS